jgi:hypothetical protein
MGINVVGDRLMFKHHLKDLSRRERFNKRIESLWIGVEQIFFSDFEKSVFVSILVLLVSPRTILYSCGLTKHELALIDQLTILS